MILEWWNPSSSSIVCILHLRSRNAQKTFWCDTKLSVCARSRAAFSRGSAHSRTPRPRHARRNLSSTSYDYRMEEEAAVGRGGGGAATPDAVFRTVPRDSTAFLVWKVTEAGTEMLPRTHYGTLYDGDCYLVYSASLPGQPAGPDVIRREIRETGASAVPGERHVHIWTGERAVTALVAAAIRRAAQLNTHIGLRSVLHREGQARESPRFLSYFRDGIRIIRSEPGGGGGSAARLYRVRGRRPTLQQLPTVGWAQLCSDGVFVLDTPALVFLWLGRAANLVEKIFGAKIAYRMARGAEKGMTARRITIAHDGYEQTLPAAERALLDALLELRARAVRSGEPRQDAHALHARLYRAHNVPGARVACRLEEVKRAPLYREDLADDGVYVVDASTRGVWAWVGPAAGVSASTALAHARAFARKRRACASVSSTPAGREPLEFCALFVGWNYGDARRDGRLRVARSATTRLDAQSLAGAAWLAAQAQLLDDGSGALRAWRVRARLGVSAERLQELPHPQSGVFYDQDCYVVLYTYHAPTGDQSVIYYWMGGSSPNDLRNLGAKEAKDLYTKLGRLPVQVRVHQGKEPAHFLQIFKGRMITYVGSATDNDPHGRRQIAPARSIVRVSGQYAREARGTEVRASTGSAHGAGACYVVREGARVWVWCATCATGDEREVAKQMAAADHVLVMQGKEKEDFWTALGDRKNLLIPSPLKEVEKPLPARLFYVSTGIPEQYSFEEIISYNQYELLPEMAAMLDAHGVLYVWLGEHCCPLVKDAPLAIADKYLQTDPAARDLETPVVVLNQGREPPSFTGFFPHWKPNLWKGHKTFNAIVSALEGKSIIHSSHSTLRSGNSENAFDRHEKYPLTVLRGPLDKIPHNVDPLSKELYLTHDDFVATFHMTYSHFKNLPNWKQKDLKKSVGLF